MDQLETWIEKRIEERIRKVIREENTAFISALIKSFQQVIVDRHEGVEGAETDFGAITPANGMKERRTEKVVKEELEPRREDKTASLNETHSFIDFSNTKGIRKQTIEMAEIIAKILLKHGESLKLKQIKSELQKHGKDLGSNSTTRMHAIMKICPGIKKVGHGRYTYEP